MTKAHTRWFSWTALIMASLISGGGWILIPSQINALPVEFSIGYRFCLTSLILVIVVRLRREKLFDKKILKILLIQGIITHPISYFCSYSACKYLPSGIVGLISSMMILPTYILGIVTKEYYFSLKMTIVLIISALGLVLVSESNVFDYDIKIVGIFFIIISTFSSSFGYTLVRKMSIKTDLSVFAITALSTGTSGLTSLSYAFLKHGTFEFPEDTGFLVNLILLGVVLTPFVYVCLYYLSTKFSTIHTAYVFAFSPVISILLSILVEGYAPTLWNYVGIAIIIISSIVSQKKVLDLKTVSTEKRIKNEYCKDE